MTSNDTITAVSTLVSYVNGNPVASDTSVDIACYVDFSNNRLILNKDGENVKTNATIFITKETEKEKLTFIPNEIIYNGIKYNVLNYEIGLKHIEITV